MGAEKRKKIKDKREFLKDFDRKVKIVCIQKQSNIVFIKARNEKSSNDFPANIIITTFVHIQFSFFIPRF